MKLYYAPGTCSLAPHIALREAGLEFGLEKVDLGTRKTEGGADFTAVNANGYVPALDLDGGEVLTEGPAIVQYIADRKPAANLAPANGTLARARLQEQLNFISTELHKSFSPLFKSDSTEAEKDKARAKVRSRFDHVERLLSDRRAYLAGDAFSVADAYLFTVARWTKPTGIGLDNWPHLKDYVARVAARPAVQAALKAEGLQAA